ncbi:hypothetical protein DACRYDRAFT_19948 [Dacryopinax primogenitus]|uniref:Uncharacterized protein n=1 Tax=Dacryopinax primogenitus (strain DJM 731) TaxID=1858805 RepID=M5G5C7_DACPD|nr:uncharacterized protein DACRYDRAFT_19948 [Dacryopinax primogenitus]EJU05461.1 hypothetical protein DACRYDRAFT_19948 [Dacryopinax primogenitus]
MHKEITKRTHNSAGLTGSRRDLSVWAKGTRSYAPTATMLPIARISSRPACSRAVYLQRRTPVIRRTFLGWLKSKTKAAPAPPKPLLEQDDLFHPFTTSPIPSIRDRAKVIKSMAPCPVCLEINGQNKTVTYDCLDCGWPTHCSEEHHAQDLDHAKYCGRLREVNEDEHDLRSGRQMWEFELPGEQSYEEAISFANWDLLWYTRGFPSIDTDRSRRHLSKLLTYPMTIAGILHQYSGFTTRNQRLTPEGARSMAALRSVLFSDAAISSRENPLALQDTVRVFMVGARAESSLPPHVWEELNHCFPNVNIHLHFIGPQAALPAAPSSDSSKPTDATTTAEQAKSAEPAPVETKTAASTPVPTEHPAAESGAEGESSPLAIWMPATPVISKPGMRSRDELAKWGVPSYTDPRNKHMTLTSIRSRYEEMHEQFGPFDPYTDVFFFFCPGFGFPSPTHPELLQIESPDEWAGVLQELLPTKCAIFVTGFSPTDVERDVKSLDGVAGVEGEFDWILTPGNNPFGSEKWDVADFDPRVMIRPNWGVWGIRGKQREIQRRHVEEFAG